MNNLLMEYLDVMKVMGGNMKTNIQRVKYNKTSNKPDLCEWYSWKEICDDCGCVIQEFNDFISTGKPNTEETDRCLYCLRKWFEKR